MLRVFTAVLFVLTTLTARQRETVDATLVSSDLATLKLLLVVYRHGERTPVVTCPTDVNTASFLATGLGELTVKGMRMHYELGGFLRRRYGQFLHERYHHNFTVVRSADYDRTLMSAEANLAALYPPDDDEVLAKELRWRPTPVHSLPIAEDFELEFPDACAKYRELLEDLKQSPEIVRLLASYKTMFSFISENCGVPIKTLEDGMFIYDLLDIERRMNLTLPSWASAYIPSMNGTLFPDLLVDVYRRSFDILSYTAQLRRLGGGALLADMLRYMNSSVRGTLSPPQRQLFVYSGHDSDLAALQATLGVYNDLPPPLASCIMIELHQNSSADGGGYFVRILYRNDTKHEPFQLQIPVCGSFSCPWPKFSGHFWNLVPSDIKLECHVPVSILTYRDTILIVLSVSMALLLTIIAAFGATRGYRQCRACSLRSSSSLSIISDY